MANGGGEREERSYCDVTRKKRKRVCLHARTLLICIIVWFCYSTNVWCYDFQISIIIPKNNFTDFDKIRMQ